MSTKKNRRGKKKIKQTWCFICAAYVPKKQTVFLHQTSPIKHICKSHIDAYDPDKRYIWDEESQKAVPGYTQSEIREIKEKTLTPEEKLQARHKAQEDARALMVMMHRLEYYEYTWRGMQQIKKLKKLR